MSQLYKLLLPPLSLFALAMITLFSEQGHAATKTLAGLKAAYVYNIAKFTRWPEWKLPNDASSLNFCLYGSGDVIEQLKSVHGRRISAHSINVYKPEQESQFENCHLLYISPSEKRRYRYLLSLIDPTSVLTISDDERFIRSGGFINLVEHQQRLRFEISQKVYNSQRMQLSSKLLKLAMFVDN